MVASNSIRYGSLLRQTIRETVPALVPDDLVVAGLMAWTYLFGAVSFEVFGHRTGVIGDPGAFFEYELLRIAELLGLVG